MGLLDWLFPARCVQCHCLSSWLCTQCHTRFIQQCSFKVYGVDLSRIDQVFVSCKDPSSTLARLLYAWKYRLCHDAGKILQNVLAQAFCTTFGSTADLICVPVPVHKQKLRDRGFNQARSMLDLLASVSFLQIMDLVLRQKNTRSQVGLNKMDRIQNLNQAFCINPKLFNPNLLSCRVVLIDDILTSGTTIQECAEILRKVGFKKIDALVVHRGTR